MKAFRETLAAAGLLFAILIAAYGCFTLPQRFPTHFDANNIADGWSGKSSLWFGPGIACVIYVVLTLVRFLPQSSISCFSEASPEQRAAALPFVHALFDWVKAEMTWMFAAITWTTVAEAQGHSIELTMWILPPSLIAIFGTIIYYITRMNPLKPAKSGAQ